MKIEKIVDIFSILSGKSRVQILKAIIKKPQYVEELKERFNLSTSTISFHLSKLKKAGLVEKEKHQYYSIYSAKIESLNYNIIDLLIEDDDEKQMQEMRLNEYKKNIIKKFFINNNLLKIPSQKPKQQIIFEAIADNFDSTKMFNSSEIDEELQMIFPNYNRLKELLIKYNFLVEENGLYTFDSSNIIKQKDLL
ncbi:MAG: metalloregulator ArsR/SmtB family transcription factor [Candidatus Cloacimonadota bacterium]|nr:metalloregulator ArsR/SmtB family transcription factor [Candidatus Cloacimonadota bacterium]